jgi:hypothetical protein
MMPRQGGRASHVRNWHIASLHCYVGYRGIADSGVASARQICGSRPKLVRTYRLLTGSTHGFLFLCRLLLGLDRFLFRRCLCCFGFSFRCLLLHRVLGGGLTASLGPIALGFFSAFARFAADELSTRDCCAANAGTDAAALATSTTTAVFRQSNALHADTGISAITNSQLKRQLGAAKHAKLPLPVQSSIAHT